MQLPLIPWIETDYFISGTNETLAEGITLMETDSSILKIEVPNYFAEDDQCFDVWFNSKIGEQKLTVTDFKFTVNDKDDEIPKKASYLFWDDGSKDETFEITDYTIEYSETYDQKKYVFFRTVYNVDDIRNFNIEFESNFSVNNRPYKVNKSLAIEKSHRWTWNKFRVH